MGYRMDYSKVAETSGFEPIPAGTYSVVIEAYEETQTQKMKPMIKIRCRVLKGEHENKKIFDQVVLFEPDDKGAGMTKHFLHVIGEPFEGEFEVDPQNWVGKKLEVMVIIDEKYNNNKVKSRNFYEDIPF